MSADWDDDDEGPDYEGDRLEAARWAAGLVRSRDFVVLDCETTGLPDRDPAVAIVQIAVVAGDGAVLLDTLVKPDIPIPAAATAIHGLTAEMVAEAPTFPEIYQRLGALLDERTVVIYNRDFEWQVLGQCAERAGLEILSVLRWKCLMEKYAAWYGDWNDWHGSYRWQRLPGAGHTALEDCRAVLKLLARMAKAALLLPEGADLQAAIIAQRAADVAAGMPACRVCGCTQNAACQPPCWWAEPDLCSTCAHAVTAGAAP